MLLIGQFISPFVRRVGVALSTYALPFDHEPWSTFGDAPLIERYNPGLRVPVLVLDDGTALTESLLILEYLDALMPPDCRLRPQDTAAHAAFLAIRGQANVVADKSVALVYHQRMHGTAPDDWQQRCLRQIAGSLESLEAQLSTRGTDGVYFHGRLTHSDIAAATAFRFAFDSHGAHLVRASYPLLQNHSRSMEALPAFRRCIHGHMVPHTSRFGHVQGPD
jgi:glutathione S-transferase